MLDIKIRQGRLILEREPIARSVTYEVHCTTAQEEEIIIDIHEDGSQVVRPKPILLGALNLFFPKRIWDARLIVMGSMPIGGEYKTAVASMVSSFKIAQLASKQEVNISIESPPDFIIKGISVRKETVHRSHTYPDLRLHLQEVINTNCRASTNVPCSYGGSIATTSEMAATSKAWWTAGISSMKADHILKRNQSLELGEIAAWTPEDVLQSGVVSDFLYFAEQIVTRIDHVGLSTF